MKLFLITLITCAGLQCLGQDTTRFTFRFPSDESGLSKAQIRSLDSLILSLDGFPDLFMYYIQGHTDNIGDRSYNVRLSEKRCRSVKKYLAKKGINENKISFEKFGFDAPVATNETETGRADNRRTTLTIITDLPAPDWDIPLQHFDINSGNETILTTRNGCKITIPGDAFVLPDALPLSGKIELEVTEYNNPAYFIASGIPMSYNASGKVFMYHSEEMLKIQAFNNSTLLELKDGVKITLNCRKVDSLYETGFYKFDLQEHKWFEHEKRRSAFEVSLEKKEGPQKKPEERKKKDHKKENLVITDNDKEDKPDTKDKKKTLSDSEEEDDIDKIEKVRIDTGGFYKVKIDSGGSRAKPIVLADASSDCCPARFYIHEGARLSEEPFDSTGIVFRNFDPGFIKLNKVIAEQRSLNKKYSPVRLEVKKLFLRRKARVKIKYDKEKHPELKELRKLKWTYSFRKNPEPYSSFKKRKFSELRITYDPVNNTAVLKLKENDRFVYVTLKPKDPQGAIRAKMDNYQKELTKRVLPPYVCFWAFNDKFFAREERGLSFKNWIGYFNTHLHQVHHCFDSLKQNIEKVIAGLHCPCISPPPCVGCDSSGGGKILLRTSGPNRILIIGLGLYNYDVVIPIEDQIFFNSPVFMDQKGKKIHPKECFLLLGDLKGVIHFGKKDPLFLVANYKNKLFIVDQANRRYKIMMEAGEDIRHRDSVFILRDITTETQNLKGLETELIEK
jgi:hypothetical protein